MISELVFALCGFVNSLHGMQVQNCYKIKKDYSPVPKSPVAVKKNVWPQRQQPPPPPEFVASNETIKEAAETAAYRIAEAESKSYLAAEAVKEAERIARLAEDAEAMLQLVQQIYDACTSTQLSYLLNSEFSN